MKSSIKISMKNLVELVGIDLHRNGKGLLGTLFPNKKYISTINGFPLKFAPNENERFNWLSNLKIKTIIDIGASNGGFAAEIRELLPHAQIYSFEPLHDEFVLLTNKFKNTPRFRAFNIALGEIVVNQ